MTLFAFFVVSRAIACERANSPFPLKKTQLCPEGDHRVYKKT